MKRAGATIKSRLSLFVYQMWWGCFVPYALLLGRVKVSPALLTYGEPQPSRRRLGCGGSRPTVVKSPGGKSSWFDKLL